MNEQVSRRDFLKTVAGGVGVLVSLPVLNQSVFARPKDEFLPAGKLADFKLNTVASVLEGQAFIARDKEGLWAMSTVCPHEGEPVTIDTDGTLICESHGSTFRSDGKVTRGPSKRNLNWVQVKIEDGTVFVNARRTAERGKKLEVPEEAAGDATATTQPAGR